MSQLCVRPYRSIVQEDGRKDWAGRDLQEIEGNTAFLRRSCDTYAEPTAG